MNGTAIVGMHRSGTSAVARVVHNLGAFMGNDFLPPSEYNPTGYYEDATLVDFHTRVMGGNWIIPSMRKAFSFREPYRVVLQEFLEKEVWAIKDPRLCFCLPLLRSIVPAVRVIAVFRDPFNAAKSLAARNGMPFEVARDLSLAYMKQMLINIESVPNVLHVRYMDLIKYPISTVDSIAKFIEVRPVPDAYSAIKPSLAHWEVEDCKNDVLSS